LSSKINQLQRENADQASQIRGLVKLQLVQNGTMIHVNNSSVSRDNVACGFVQGRLKPMLASCPWQILFEDVIESELEKE
jgi:hypothetical protein